MDLQGSHKFNAAPQQVWNALMDPAILKETIPGAKDVTVTANAIDVVIAISLPVFSGEFSGNLQIVSQTPPQQAVLSVDRSGSYGSIKGQTTIDLAPDGAGTNLTYTAHFDMGGKIGMVPGMILEPAAKSGLSSFFKNLDSKIK